MAFDLDYAAMDGLAQRLEYAQSLYQAGEDPAGIPQKLYCHFLPDTSEYQGKLMADYLRTRIEEFDRTSRQLAAYPGEEGKRLLAAQLGQLLEGADLDRQCRQLYQLREGMAALELGLQTGVEPEMNQIGFYTGEVTPQARNELLRQVTDRLLDQPAQPESFPRWFLSQSRKRLKELDRDAYRAVLSMSVYTLLLEGGCAQTLRGRPVSLDFVAAEVCRCSVPEVADASWVKQGWLDWSTAKIFLAMGILAGGCAVVILSESLAVTYAAYYATVLSVGALILFWNELDSLPAGEPLQAHTGQEDWLRAKARDTMVLRGQLTSVERNKHTQALEEEVNPQYDG